MNNFTTNIYEMKRKIVNFSKKVSKGLNKSTSKFVMDMQYGLAKGGSVLIPSLTLCNKKSSPGIDLSGFFIILYLRTMRVL